MQQEPLPFPPQPREYQWEQLFDYFVRAEETQSIVTSVSIQKTWPREPGEKLELDGVRWYMYRYWRWFLFCIDDQVRPYQYKVKNIRNYPRDYFIQAHMDPKRMQYLVHFLRSIEQDKEERRQAVGTGQPRKPRREGAPIQGTLLDLGIEEQLQDELDLPIDDHEREEGPIQDATETDMVDVPSTDESEAVGLSELPSGSPDLVEGDPASEVEETESSRNSEQEQPGEERVDEPAHWVGKLPPPGGGPQSGPGSDDPSPRPKPKPPSPQLAVGILVGVCVVAVVAYFLFFK